MKRGTKTKDLIILRDSKESRKSRLKTVGRKEKYLQVNVYCCI